MRLMELAWMYDATSLDDLEARIQLAEQMKPLLGARADEFDAAYGALIAAEPTCEAPAMLTLIDTGIGLTLLDYCEALNYTNKPTIRRAIFGKMQALIGERGEEFLDRFKAQGSIAATSVLCEMGLAHIPADAVDSLFVRAAKYLRESDCPDWVSAIRLVQEDMERAVRLVPPATTQSKESAS